MRIMESGRPAVVLLVEDNEDDVIITRKGFTQAKLVIELHHVENGRQCMEFLRREGSHASAPRPDLILLDLNMPVMTGREVMAELARDDVLCSIPVVVLTTTESEREILEMYRLRCSSYITKPVDFEQFLRVVRELGNYWFTVVVLPTED
ncbi:MAG: response regulator [Planctomycetaceae bacterium]